ncbi:MAG: xanthine dehydrogenase family protein subunit M [Actinomycetota bacterium]|nr:xanthine dehydrogenase family protein subunit M [Actinomycetota bacterium]
MYPRSFDYIAPSTLDEALEALASRPGARVLAGGHSLLPMMKLRLLSPELLVDIGRIGGMAEIREEGEELIIGANVTHAQSASSGVLREQAAALWEAACWVGDPQVRNRGTVCGSIAHADPASDEPAAVLALGATMVVRSMESARRIPSSEFFLDTMTSAVADGEILTEIRIPKRQVGEGSAYDKLGRRGGHSDFAVAGAAAWVRRQDSRVADARLALTGVGSVAALAPKVAEELRGTDGSAEAIERAAIRAVEGSAVVEDLYGSEEYKAHLAVVYAKRALRAAMERAGAGDL